MILGPDSFFHPLSQRPGVRGVLVWPSAKNGLIVRSCCSGAGFRARARARTLQSRASREDWRGGGPKKNIKIQFPDPATLAEVRFLLARDREKEPRALSRLVAHRAAEVADHIWGLVSPAALRTLFDPNVSDIKYVF